MSAFIWVASYGANKNISPAVLTASFGEGYEQSAPDGINSIRRVWTVPFNNRPQSEIDAIEAFLISCAGSVPFDWTDPDGFTGRWKCPKWSRSPVAGTLGTLTATFNQVFGV